MMPFNMAWSFNTLKAAKFIPFFPIEPIERVLERRSAFPAFGSLNIGDGNILSIADIELESRMISKETVSFFNGV